MKKCSICNEEYDGYGNHTWPLKRKECCSKCNMNVVVPLRVYLSGVIKNQILCINTNGECVYKVEDKEVSLDTLQELVDGYIEVYPKKDKHFYYIVNEEGILKGMEYNMLANELLGIDVLGPVVLVPKHLFK